MVNANECLLRRMKQICPSFHHAQEEPTSIRTKPRRRPLHTCGASLIAIAHKAGEKMQDFDGPLGSIVRRAMTILNLFIPFVYWTVCNWLAVLSFIDDNILCAENVLEIIFPPSKRLFDKIDSLVCSAEALPEQIEDLFRNFPMLIQKLPILDWILVHLISFLNSLLSALYYWGVKNRAREKEITIDVSCKHSCSCCRFRSDGKTSHAEQNHEKYDPLHAKGQVEMGHIKESNELSNCDEVVVLKSDGRLASLKRMHEAEEEPHYFYESAPSSPFSDCSQDESKATFSPIMSRSDATSYKDVLKKGTTEGEGAGRKETLLAHD